jgi:hypothetical protein
VTRSARVLGALALTLAMHAALAAAPKQTSKLTVSLSGQQIAIEITEPSVLALSNVFEGAFIADESTPPDHAWPRYTVVFDVQTLNGVKESAYTVEFSRNPDTGESFVYLPGYGDAPYRRNISTILRTSQDGRWHHASEAWSLAIVPRLP